MSEPAADFNLEPPLEPGHIPPRVVDELRHVYRVAKDYAGAFGDSVKAQAEKHKIAPGALRKYIAALEGDKLSEAAKEADDLARLLGDVGANTTEVET
jgi:hypothetical protein